jgi:hypothetical protein
MVGAVPVGLGDAVVQVRRMGGSLAICSFLRLKMSVVWAKHSWLARLRTQEAWQKAARLNMKLGARLDLEILHAQFQLTKARPNRLKYGTI